MIGAALGNSRLAVSTAVVGTVLIATAAFWLSFTALRDLAHRSGVSAGQAWAWPLIVDGLIVVATVAVVALDGRQAWWYPWLLLAAGAAVSVAANALHATVAADADIPRVLAACVAAVPPLVLLASTHLTVVLLRSHTATGARTVEEQVRTADHSDTATDRREVAAGLRVGGWSNKAIARELQVAPSTVGRWFARTEALGAPEGQQTPKELTS